jgi:hypothetical protein
VRVDVESEAVLRAADLIERGLRDQDAALDRVAAAANPAAPGSDPVSKHAAWRVTSSNVDFLNSMLDARNKAGELPGALRSLVAGYTDADEGNAWSLGAGSGPSEPSMVPMIDGRNVALIAPKPPEPAAQGLDLPSISPMIHDEGSGSGGLRDAAAGLRSYGSEAHDFASVLDSAHAILADGYSSPAADALRDRVTEHAAWWREAPQHAAQNAQHADEHAARYELAAAKYPRPQQFAEAGRRTGDYQGVVQQAHAAYGQYATDSPQPPGGPEPAPWIVNPSGDLAADPARDRWSMGDAPLDPDDPAADGSAEDGTDPDDEAGGGTDPSGQSDPMSQALQSALGAFSAIGGQMAGMAQLAGQLLSQGAQSAAQAPQGLISSLAGAAKPAAGAAGLKAPTVPDLGLDEEGAEDGLGFPDLGTTAPAASASAGPSLSTLSTAPGSAGVGGVSISVPGSSPPAGAVVEGGTMMPPMMAPPPPHGDKAHKPNKDWVRPHTGMEYAVPAASAEEQVIGGEETADPEALAKAAGKQ